MRFDQIDLIGDFKIEGATGTSGQAIGFSGSTVEWINAASGGSQNQLSSTGYNYIIIAATGSNAQNGSTLLSAYTTLQSYAVGTLAVDNRLTLFLTPGVYDFGSSFLTVVSFVDIVGLSSNPYDTVIKSTGATNYFMTTTNVDFGLENVYLSGEKYWRDLSSGGGGYFRLKNVVIGGNTFDGTNFADLNGEFKNIKVLDGANFAYVSSAIDGTYENIEIGSVPNAFVSGAAMTGNYKNINIGGISSNGFNSSSISINFFENIKLYNFTGTNFLVSSGNISGQFKNISIPNNSSGVVFNTNSSGDLGDSNSRFENIEIGNIGSAFSNSDTIYGTYKSIKIGNCDEAFNRNETFDSSVNFDHITIGNCGEAFNNDIDILTGDFKNIKVGDVNVGRIFTSVSDINGTYKSIKIGDVASNVFSATSSIAANFNDIEIGNVGNDLFCAPTFNSNITNLKSKNITGSFIESSTSITGEFKNIELGNIVFRSIYSDGAILGTFSNIKMGNVSDRGPVYSTSTTIGGSVKNLEAGNVGGLLRSTTGFDSGYFAEDIKFLDSSQDVFSSVTSGPIMGRVKNVKMGNINGSAFFADSGSTFSGVFENIEIDSVSGDCFFTNDSVFDGLTIRNLTIGSVSGVALSTDQPTNPTNDAFNNVITKDVEIGSGGDIFRTSVGTAMRMRYSRFENITIGTCSTVFRSLVDSGTEIKNLYSTGNFGYSFDGSAVLINSNVNMSDRNFGLTFSGITIDRSKIVTSAGYTVSIPTGNITLYSIFSYAGLTAAGLSYSNIVDSDVTF